MIENSSWRSKKILCYKGKWQPWIRCFSFSSVTLDNCRVWLNLAIDLVHPTIDMKRKEDVCVHICTSVHPHAWKRDKCSFKVKKAQNLKLIWGLKFIFLFICKVKGTKECVNYQLLRFLYINCSLIAIYNNLYKCIPTHIYNNKINILNNGWNYKDSTISVSLYIFFYV